MEGQSIEDSVKEKWSRPQCTIKPTPLGWEPLTEGQATVIFQDKKKVFYNQPQEANRDLSILMIQMYIDEVIKERGDEFDGVTIFEGLSASGLRSIRYWKELYGVKSILVNDLEEEAVESIRRNLDHNGVDEARVIANKGDASMVMYQHRQKEDQFDVIDLDPYGSAAIFLDSAVQSVSEGGLLCITCTDMQVLCGNYPEVCFYKYGGMPLKGKITHEQALRILIASVERTANRYKRHIVPQFCLSMDFYVRVFVRVYTCAEEVKRSCLKISTVYECTGCGALHFQPLGECSNRTGSNAKFSAPRGPPVGEKCVECGRGWRIAGPIWNEALCNHEFLVRALERLEKNKAAFKTHTKIYGMMSVIASELPDQPLFYDLAQLCRLLHIQQPSMAEFRSALLSHEKGYRVSISHTDALAVKTDAPISVLWDILRSWNKLHPVKRIPPGSPAAAILAKEPAFEADFTVRADAMIPKNAKPRFTINPPRWGPGTRGKFNVNKRKAAETEEEEGEEKEKKEEGEKEDEEEKRETKRHKEM